MTTLINYSPYGTKKPLNNFYIYYIILYLRMLLSDEQKANLAKGRNYRISMHKGIRSIKKRLKTTKKNPHPNFRSDDCPICYSSYKDVVIFIFCPICENWFCYDCWCQTTSELCSLCSSGKRKHMMTTTLIK